MAPLPEFPFPAKVLLFGERRDRIRENLAMAWHDTNNCPQDPGLRDTYPNLPRAPIRLIVCPMVKDINQGGILRLADAYRLERVYFSPEEDGAVDFTGSVGSTIWQPYEWMAAQDAISQCKADGFQIVGLALNDRSLAIERAPWQFPCAIVLGAERLGIPPEVEEMCDATIALPLYGMMTSLNISQAAAIGVHEAIRALRIAKPDFEPVRELSKNLLKSTTR